MATSLWELLKKYKVVIPIIQRDYAQGRSTGKVPLIRDNILNALFTSVKQRDKVLELDFIYGFTKSFTNDDGTDQEFFYPLDGQQRLTTLFLLHWYSAATEGKLEQARDTLAHFTYETRHSSRIFCSELVKYVPETNKTPIKESIVNQPWFFTAWSNDPTINSMLTMLNSIQEKVQEFELKNIWERLTSDSPAVVFHLLPTDKLGMPDDLYIKMNSRGKELTDFEYFKIRFSELLKNPYSDEFNRKIDQQWSDLFWDLYKNNKDPNIAQIVDNAFLRFFRYITDLIIEKNSISISEGLEEFKLFENVYSNESNVSFLLGVLDLFVDTNKSNPGFFSSVFYTEPSDFHPSKTRLFFIKPKTDLFKKCADAYDANQRNNPFSIGEQLLLYACIIHLQNRTSDFCNRIRKIRNLISNSEDTVRKENMTTLLNSVYEIVVSGNLDADSSFSNTQINEESEKENLINQYPHLSEILHQLEDHHLLQGCTAIFGLTPDIDQYALQFRNIFVVNCDYLLISRALFTFGDYSQRVSWIRLLGNMNQSTWRSLFTPSIRRGGFQNTKDVLNKFLSSFVLNPTCSIKGLIDSFLLSYDNEPYKEKGWNYYFIKYPEFRYHLDGYYYWPDYSVQYVCTMLRRKTLGGWHWDPFLKAICIATQKGVSIENYGKPLIYVKGGITLRITNHRDCYKIEGMDEDSKSFLSIVQNLGLLSLINTCPIKQSANGLDIEDRVQVGIKLIEEFNEIKI